MGPQQLRPTAPKRGDPSLCGGRWRRPSQRESRREVLRCSHGSGPARGAVMARGLSRHADRARAIHAAYECDGCPQRSFATFPQKCSRLSVPPNKVVKIVESASRTSPPRVTFEAKTNPDEGVELPAPGGGGTARTVQVDRLVGQGRRADLLSCSRRRVVRQMQMEVERGHSIQQAQLVEIPWLDGQRKDLVGPSARRRAEPVLIEHGHLEPLHQRSRVLAEAVAKRGTSSSP